MHHGPKDSVDALLASWEQRRPYLDFTPVGIVSRLGRVRRRIAAELDAVYAAHGLTAPTFGVLVTLARVDDGEGVTQRRLMDELGLTSGTISVRMDRLVEEGLVEREPDPASRRATRIRLTERGRELFERVVPEHLATERRLLSGLDERQAEQLADLLRVVLLELEGSEPPAGGSPRLGLTVAPAHAAMTLRASVGLDPLPALLVRAVEQGGPAAEAGLRTGDVLERAGERRLQSVGALYEALDEAGGRPLELLVLRGADELTLTVDLGGEASPRVRPARGLHVL